MKTITRQVPDRKAITRQVPARGLRVDWIATIRVGLLRRRRRSKYRHLTPAEYEKIDRKTHTYFQERGEKAISIDPRWLTKPSPDDPYEKDTGDSKPTWGRGALVSEVLGDKNGPFPNEGLPLSAADRRILFQEETMPAS